MAIPSTKKSAVVLTIPIGFICFLISIEFLVKAITRLGGRSPVRAHNFPGRTAAVSGLFAGHPIPTRIRERE